MIRSLSIAVALCVVVVLDADLTWAQETVLATISDQRVDVPVRDSPTLEGTIWDERYYGVKFSAVPEASIPVDPALQPKSLLARLDPSLKVEGVGRSVGDKPLTSDQVLASLPTTAFRIVLLSAKDGGAAVKFYGTGPILYVTGYETTPSRPPPTLDDIKHGRFGDREHVRINAYTVRILDVKSCEALGVCWEAK